MQPIEQHQYAHNEQLLNFLCFQSYYEIDNIVLEILIGLTLRETSRVWS